MIWLVLAVLGSAGLDAQVRAAQEQVSTNRTVLENNSPADAKKAVASDTQEYLTFGLDRVPFLQPVVLGNRLWKYLAFLIYVILAFYVSKLIDVFFHAWLKKLTARTETKFDDLLIDVLHGPVKVIAFVVLLHIGLDLFSWPVWLDRYISIALKLMVAGSLTYVTIKVIDLSFNYWKLRAAADADRAFREHLFPMLCKAIKVFVVVVAILLTSQNLGMNITSLLASLSVGGLALGLAAQDTLGNLFGAIVIYFDKPFHIGDRIQLEGGVDGQVESIGLRSTRVRNLDGHLITVPNKTMGNATITNVARRPTIKTEMNIGLTYDTSPKKIEHALAILSEVFRSHPMTHDVLIGFNKFADSSLNIQVVHWWKNTDYTAYMAGLQKMNLEIKRRFDAEGISFAFPSQTVYLKQDSEWRLANGTSVSRPAAETN